MMLTKAPNPVDRHVGSRVRMRRMLVGMSQEKLGEALGITFQQIQKYEKGTNRIGASRLHDIARTLGVPIEFFYEGAGGEAGSADDPAAAMLSAFVTSPGALDLIRAFLALQSPRQRRLAIEFVQTLAGQE